MNSVHLFICVLGCARRLHHRESRARNTPAVAWCSRANKYIFYCVTDAERNRRGKKSSDENQNKAENTSSSSSFT